MVFFGGRSVVTVFRMRQRGFDAWLLEGGMQAPRLCRETGALESFSATESS
jgi:hypothetical protein